MHRKFLVLIIVVGVFILEAPKVLAQDDDEPIVGMQLSCTYFSPKSQWTSIRTKENISRTANAASSAHLNSDTTSASFDVVPGRFAECIYPNGDSVRIKVGTGRTRAYGACGGDPQIFVSLWVNQRKVDSRAWFAGHCHDAGPLWYSIQNNNVQKCQSTGVENKVPEVCVQFPQTERFPLDELEYPKGASLPVGSVAILTGEEPVCRVVRNELASKWTTSRLYRDPVLSDDPTFENLSGVRVDEKLLAQRQSRFDFDNDGKPDQVTDVLYRVAPIHSQGLLINSEVDSTSHLVDGWFLPCQFDAKNIALRQCPPFTETTNEPGFSMEKPDGGDVQFLARYSLLTPIRYESTSYLLVSSTSDESLDYVAIVKPKVDRSFERTCLLRRVPENF